MAPTQQIAIVAFPGVQPLDVVGPHEVFAGVNQVFGQDVYDIRVVASSAGAVRGESGLALHAEALSEGQVHTLIAAGGTGVFAARADDVLISWITQQAKNADRLASVCTGTFLLAEAGLLVGQRVTTHWARAERLALEYPQITVDVDPIYLRSGRIWTSAGVTAGLDMSLAIVADEHGAAAAQTIARWLVMLRRRSGGQSQFASAVWTKASDVQPIQAVIERIHAEPQADLSVETLAAAASLSTRHFSRLFTDQIGVPPGRYVDNVRVETARHRLEQTTDTIDAIARTSGFGTSETMRRTFVRQLRVTPDQYRRHFALHPATT